MSPDKGTWTRDEPPALLSRAEITRLLDPWLAGREVLDAEYMPGGLSNRNFLLRLSGRPQECVLRIYDRDPAACAKEVAVLGMIGRELPVPRVLYADDGLESGVAVSVLSVMNGISLFTLRQMNDAESLSEACYDVGRVLARMKAFPGPPTGHVTIVSLVKRFTGSATFAARVPDHTAQALVDLAVSWQPRLDVDANHTSLVHGDFNSPNIFVQRADDGWRVSGLLDWEFALDATPYVDIGNFLRYHRADRPRYEPDFSRGLRDGGMQLSPDWLMLARICDLPALCELLARRELPDFVIAELRLLIDEILSEAHG